MLRKGMVEEYQANSWDEYRKKIINKNGDVIPKFLIHKKHNIT